MSPGDGFFGLLAVFSVPLYFLTVAGSSPALMIAKVTAGQVITSYALPPLHAKKGKRKRKWEGPREKSSQRTPASKPPKPRWAPLKVRGPVRDDIDLVRRRGQELLRASEPTEEYLSASVLLVR